MFARSAWAWSSRHARSGPWITPKSRTSTNETDDDDDDEDDDEDDDDDEHDEHDNDGDDDDHDYADAEAAAPAAAAAGAAAAAAADADDDDDDHDYDVYDSQSRCGMALIMTWWAHSCLRTGHDMTACIGWLPVAKPMVHVRSAEAVAELGSIVQTHTFRQTRSFAHAHVHVHIMQVQKGALWGPMRCILSLHKSRNEHMNKHLRIHTYEGVRLCVHRFLCI